MVERNPENPSKSLFVSTLLNSYCLDQIIKQRVTSNINQFYIYQLPIPRLNSSNPHFDALVPRAARLTCTRAEFADLWQDVMGEAWDESKGATDPAERQRLRDEIDAIVAHLYGLSRDDFDHILGTFPLVFPDNEVGKAKRAALLAVYDAWAGKL
jgi:hypothetical protein